MSPSSPDIPTSTRRSGTPARCRKSADSWRHIREATPAAYPRTDHGQRPRPPALERAHGTGPRSQPLADAGRAEVTAIVEAAVYDSLPDTRQGAETWHVTTIRTGARKSGWPTKAGEAKPALESRAAANRILTGAEFIAGHVPPVWLIDGIVQRGRLYACTSLTGHGKTAVWLFNACMIHAGRMIGQLDIFQGNVLILAGENPADLEARMIGMAQGLQPAAQSVALRPARQLPADRGGGRRAEARHRRSRRPARADRRRYRVQLLPRRR